MAAMVVAMAWSRRNREPERGAEDGRDRGERDELLEEGVEESTEVEDEEVEDEECGETDSERRRRYLQSSLCEVCDPDEWMSIRDHVEESSDEEAPEKGLPSGSTHLNPAEVAGLAAGGFPEDRVRCMNDTIHSILTIMAQFVVMPWYQRKARD